MKKNMIFILITFLFLSGCAPLIAPYDQPSIERCVTVKVETLALMDCAVDSFAIYEDRVNDLLIKSNIAYETAKLRPYNDETVAHWEIMLDPDGALAGNYFERWKEKGILKEFFINAKKQQVEQGFDEILKLEMAKNKKK